MKTNRGHFIYFYIHDSHGYIEIQTPFYNAGQQTTFSLWSEPGPHTNPKELELALMQVTYDRLKRNQYGILSKHIIKFYHNLYINQKINGQLLRILGILTIFPFTYLGKMNLDVNAMLLENENGGSLIEKNLIPRNKYLKIELSEIKMLKVINKIKNIQHTIENYTDKENDTRLYAYNYFLQNCIDFPQQIYKTAGFQGHFINYIKIDLISFPGSYLVCKKFVIPYILYPVKLITNFLLGVQHLSHIPQPSKKTNMYRKTNHAPN